MKYTYQEYMANKCDLHTYYKQFVTEHLLQYLRNKLSLQELQKAYAEDKHLNNVKTLSWWDAVPAATYAGLLSYSMADNVCIAKTAARMLIKGETL